MVLEGWLHEGIHEGIQGNVGGLFASEALYFDVVKSNLSTEGSVLRRFAVSLTPANSRNTGVSVLSVGCGNCGGKKDDRRTTKLKTELAKTLTQNGAICGYCDGE